MASHWSHVLGMAGVLLKNRSGAFSLFTPPSFSIHATYPIGPLTHAPIEDDYRIISQIQGTKLQASNFLDCFPDDYLGERKEASLAVPWRGTPFPREEKGARLLTPLSVLRHTLHTRLHTTVRTPVRMMSAEPMQKVDVCGWVKI